MQPISPTTATTARGNARLEAFVDAAFAFAVTLLVISADTIPDSVESLLLALKSLPSFAASFTMIVLFWCAHVGWSRRYPMQTATSLVLSLLLVFLVLVYVYPLRLLFGAFFSWASAGWLPMPLTSFSGVGDIVLVYVVYGIAFVSMSGCIAALYAHAWRRRQALGLSDQGAITAAGEMASYLFLAAVGVFSVLLALVLPSAPAPWLLALPGALYFLLAFTAVIDPLGQRWAARRLHSPASAD